MMLKAFRKLRGKPVSVACKDGSVLGGGIKSGEHKMVLLFLDVDSQWVVFQWEWSGQVFMVPANDVTCIVADLKEPQCETKTKS